MLLANGAKANARTNAGTTALHLAASAGSIETIQALLSRRADPTVKDKKRVTPIALMEERIVQMLRDCDRLSGRRAKAEHEKIDKYDKVLDAMLTRKARPRARRR